MHERFTCAAAAPAHILSRPRLMPYADGPPLRSLKTADEDVSCRPSARAGFSIVMVSFGNKIKVPMKLPGFTVAWK